MKKLIWLPLFLLSACGPNADENYDIGYNEGYAAGYRTPCKATTALVFDNADYNKGYQDGQIAGVIECKSKK